MYDVDSDFRAEWHSTTIPQTTEELRKALIAANLKPSSVARAPTVSKPKETKRKTARRGGKQTNAHMVLKDYSHLRK